MAQLLAALQGGWVTGDTARQVATRAAAASAPISAAQDSGSLATLALSVVAGAFAGAAIAADVGSGAAPVAVGVWPPAGAAGAGAPSRPHPDNANAATIQQAHFIFRIGVSCRHSGSTRQRSTPGIVGPMRIAAAALEPARGSVSSHRCTSGVRPSLAARPRVLRDNGLAPCDDHIMCLAYPQTAHWQWIRRRFGIPDADDDGSHSVLYRLCVCF
ncbi:hypothetical protein M3S04_00565 [Xanthomonas sp. PPL139]|uniref:hypothetical protein n=1 Tax=unclassified Xanthomonas TaxID=2643310 RepID=UPI0033BD322C